MSAKIYRPAKTAMQSGKAKTHLWVLEFDQENARTIDPIMGYKLARYASATQADIRDRGAGDGLCQRKGIEYRVVEPKEPTRKNVSYTDNFSFTRTQPWTH